MFPFAAGLPTPRSEGTYGAHYGFNQGFASESLVVLLVSRRVVGVPTKCVRNWRYGYGEINSTIFDAIYRQAHPSVREFGRMSNRWLRLAHRSSRGIGTD